MGERNVTGNKRERDVPGNGMKKQSVRVQSLAKRERDVPSDSLCERTSTAQTGLSRKGEILNRSGERDRSLC